MAAVAFSFYDALALRTDAVPHPEALFEIRRPPTPGGRVWMAFTWTQYETLRRNTDAFSGVAAELPQISARLEGQPIYGSLVTSNYFQVLGAAAAAGRTFVDGEREPVVVLSHRAWQRLFDEDETVVGRTVQLNGQRFGVLGIMPEAFRGLRSLAPPDYWAPLERLTDFRPGDRGREAAVQLPTVIGRLRADLSPAAATAQLTTWVESRDDFEAYRDAPKTIQLIPSQGTLFRSALDGFVAFSPLFVAFGLILLIGCANVANLLLARGLARHREIGVRLALGASRARIVRQLVTEGLLLALIAAAAGLVVSRLFFEVVVRTAISTVPPDTAEMLRLAVVPAGWRTFLFLITGAAVSTLLFALAPALRATRLDLVPTMRGELVRGSRPGVARNALVAVQVGASTLLLVTAAVFLRGAMTTVLAEPDIRIAETVFVDSLSEPVRPAAAEAVKTDTVVTAVAGIYPPGIRGRNADASVIEDGGTPGRQDVVTFKLVSPEYFDLLGLDVERGRVFNVDERSPSSAVAVVSARAVRELWPDRDPLGQRVRIQPWADRSWATGNVPDPAPANGVYTVVGVVPDVRVGLGDGTMYGSWVYLPTDTTQPGSSLAVRIRGDAEAALREFTARVAKVDPAVGRIWSLATAASRGTSILRMGFQMTAWLGALALLLTVSGVFGVLSYLVEQRRREIGVRLALGAQPGAVRRLVLRNAVRPVLAGLAAGAGFAGLLAGALLALPASMHVGRDIPVYDPAGYALGVACIAVPSVVAAFLPALRASRVDPIETLRVE